MARASALPLVLGAQPVLEDLHLLWRGVEDTDPFDLRLTGDGCGRVIRQRNLLLGGVHAGGDHRQIRAKRVELGEERCLVRCGDAGQRHICGHAKRDAQRCQHRAGRPPGGPNPSRMHQIRNSRAYWFTHRSTFTHISPPVSLWLTAPRQRGLDSACRVR